MVGIFSRFSVGRSGHRRTQSTLGEREVIPPNSDVAAATSAATAASHGIEVAVEFKPVEHPIEPLDSDRPIQCPLPEPSILNDGRIWKERVSASVMRRSDLPVMKEEGTLESQNAAAKTRPTQSNRMILPSLSAPEHNILNLLEECNASGI
ncbi:Cystic fibrosis transmembrane conductance regulator [Quillaja saponaria]|uniref:Cystic fibrosis transmembrane conductance regulator n=1 Tax=Quillaja saponaria TaxID=32244 RepID=A0AAD7KQL4_QUISA|nr:Cystic fibrosis transmembrane conductance regulator [Quillaja saponaria]